MDADYRSEIENPQMKRRLLAEDNVPAIEDLLDKESQRLGRLQKLKEEGRLDFGDTVSPDELRELFPQICKEVDSFLGIQDGEVPNCRYYNLFRPGLMTTPILGVYIVSALQEACALASLATGHLDYCQTFQIGAMLNAQAALSAHLLAKQSCYAASKSITLERVARTDLIPTAGHEYTHHIQFKKGLRYSKHTIFSEGQARGVQKQLADDYHEREDNEAFLYRSSDRTVGELKSAYLWMCRKLGQQPRKSLLKTKSSRDRDESVDRLIRREPSPHALGNALFSIYEALNGRGMYKQMIHGEFQFA